MAAGLTGAVGGGAPPPGRFTAPLAPSIPPAGAAGGPEGLPVMPLMLFCGAPPGCTGAAIGPPPAPGESGPMLLPPAAGCWFSCGIFDTAIPGAAIVGLGGIQGLWFWPCGWFGFMGVMKLVLLYLRTWLPAQSCVPQPRL